MFELAGRAIGACWVLFVIVWIIAARFTKRTVARSQTWLRWILAIVAVVLFATQTGRSPLANRSLWRATPGLAAVAVAVTAAGMAVAVWARTVLGGNWSGEITLKQQHELIDRGPYAFVRHPIYTGVLLMAAGTAAFVGTTAAAIFFMTMLVGLIVKARSEERWLATHLPDAFARYRARVRARLIPFVY